MKTILVIGATSGIAKAFCEIALKKGHRLILCSRNFEKLALLAEDFRIRYRVSSLPHFELDLQKHETHEAFFKKILELDPHLEGCFFAAGVMFSQEDSENDFKKTLETLNCNLVGTFSLLNLLANYFEKEKRGFISCLSSVAGDRGRGSNYIYGASKSALNTYLQGLRNRLHAKNVFVQTVKPGPVDTPMTAGLTPAPPMMVSPEKVARDIWKAIENKKDILYTPKRWFFIMAIIRAIPECLFKKMKL